MDIINLSIIRNTEDYQKKRLFRAATQRRTQRPLAAKCQASSG
jgi:hypothetical protein